MNSETFLDLLGQSGLVSEEQLDEAYNLLEGHANSPENERADWISQELQNRGTLTAWQCRQLLKGKYKGFFIRKYKLLGLLGVGGMSSVYLAEHTVMQRRVAIKVLPRGRHKKGNYLDHFIREAQVIATLDHPNIIRAYDIDIEGDVHYIVMEFFEGIDLQRKVGKEGPLTVPVIVDYIRQAAEALHYAHLVGIIHRDIKPANLLINSRNQVKLLDLGLALIDPSLYSGHLSTDHRESSILGTADYLAPEQAINSQKVDFRADIYALGGVLYFCLTGHSPFPTGSVSERLLAHQLTTPASILIDRPNTSEDLVRICERMMSKNPGDRHQSAAEVALDLQNWLIEHGHTDNRDTWTVHQVPTEPVRENSQQKTKPNEETKSKPKVKPVSQTTEKEALFEEKTAFDLSSKVYGLVDSKDPLIVPPPTFDCEGKTDLELKKKIGDETPKAKTEPKEAKSGLPASSDSVSALPTVSSDSTKRIVIQSNPRTGKSQDRSGLAESPEQGKQTTAPALQKSRKRTERSVRQEDMDDDTFDELLNNFLLAPSKSRSLPVLQSREREETNEHSVRSDNTDRSEKKTKIQASEKQLPATSSRRHLGIEMKRTDYHEEEEVTRPVMVERPPLPEEKWHEKIPLWCWGIVAFGVVAGIVFLLFGFLA